MNKKKILLIVIVLILAGAGYGAYKYNQKADTAENHKGTVVSATELVKEYAADETAANAKYLNKTLVVRGEVAEVEKNQDGQLAIAIKTDDATSSVFCNMRDKDITAKKGDMVEVKGFCSGLVLTDVNLTGCIINK